MHLYTLLAFAVVFFHSEQGSLLAPSWELSRAGLGPLLAGQLAVIVAGAWWVKHGALAMLRRQPDRPQGVQYYYHRGLTLLKTLILLFFTADVFITPWPDLCYAPGYAPWLQIAGDLCVLAPFLAGAALVWGITYPVDRSLREGVWGDGLGSSEAARHVWTRAQFLEFNFRHHVFVVALPMAMILYASNLTRGYADRIRGWAYGWPFAPDVLLGVVALGVFVIAPVILRYVWTTEPLAPGPLRRDLEMLCDRIGLRCRDILVWKSDGMMINAAVMGLARPVRYVLLSDGLLETMTDRQIEAVFGHEAGHVRHRHIEYFLLFAFVAMLLVSALMEAMARNVPGISEMAVQTVGAAATLALWGLGFGWISRRFERQADLFGAACVTPPASECASPCGVHLDIDDAPSPPVDESSNSPGPAIPPPHQAHRLCSTAAAAFVSALDRVAILNGIPHEERSWRHSSIASRMQFLTSLANDPNRLARFNRILIGIKAALLTASVVGAALAIYYYVFADPAYLR